MGMSMTGETRQPAGPSRHQQALMVWVAIVPILTILQFTVGGLLQEAPQYLRAPIMATLAVPIVVYVAMPRLQRLRTRLVKENGK
jgi:antibiotic biosynthesis monooxygenase (ABM) superfamily enzyme